MPTDYWGNAIFSVVPTIVLGLLFWLIMRAIVRADRSERSAYGRIEAQERARFEAERAAATAAPATAEIAAETAESVGAEPVGAEPVSAGDRPAGAA